MGAVTKADAVAAVQAARRARRLRWGQLAEAIGRSPAWTTTALLGRHQLGEDQGAVIGELLELDDEVIAALCLPAERGESGVDHGDPVIARLDEVVQVYGPAIRELILEEFGDGIMSAIDFELSIERRAAPAGDRVVLTLDGKFLAYREW